MLLRGVLTTRGFLLINHATLQAPIDFHFTLDILSYEHTQVVGTKSNSTIDSQFRIIVNAMVLSFDLAMLDSFFILYLILYLIRIDNMIVDIHCIIPIALIGFKRIWTHAFRPVPTTHVSAPAALVVSSRGFVMSRYSMADACHPF